MHTGALGIQTNDNSNNSNKRFKKNAVWSSGVLGRLKAEVRLKTLRIFREAELEINTYVIPSLPCIDAVQTVDGPAFWICLVSSLILLSFLLLLSTMTTAHYP